VEEKIKTDAEKSLNLSDCEHKSIIADRGKLTFNYYCRGMISVFLQALSTSIFTGLSSSDCRVERAPDLNGKKAVKTRFNYPFRPKTAFTASNGLPVPVIVRPPPYP